MPLLIRQYPDSLQKLRLDGKNADKVLDSVVTSVLATLPDRASESMIQFISEHSPANWYTSLEKHPTKDIFIKKFDEKVLKDIMNVSLEDKSLVNEYFKKSVEEELEIVM